MIKIHIPGYQTLELRYLVLDYNGTLAHDGELLPGVDEALATLAEMVEIHIVTADTFGRARAQLEGVPCRLTVLPAAGQDRSKARYVRRLGAKWTASIGNGRNDRLMIRQAALGIVVVQGEGAAAETVKAADVICPTVASAFGLLRNSDRLVATLRR